MNMKKKKSPPAKKKKSAKPKPKPKPKSKSRAKGKAKPTRSAKRTAIMRHSREGMRGPAAKAKKGSSKGRAKPRSPKRPLSARPRPRAARTGIRRDVESPWSSRGLGPEAGGQSGDTEGLSREESADSESVEELLEEGQAFEAGVVSGVENAPDADKGGVRTRQVPEDDVPLEYDED